MKLIDRITFKHVALFSALFVAIMAFFMSVNSPKEDKIMAVEVINPSEGRKENDSADVNLISEIEEEKESTTYFNEKFKRIVTNEYIKNSVKHKIVLTYQKFSMGEYTFFLEVFINDKKIQENDIKKQTLIGCGDEFGVFIEIEQLIAKNKEVKGWIVDGLYSVCGNTRSLKTFLITPISDNDFEVFEIDSKKGITFNPISNNEIEIWYYYQEWAGLGTVSSFFVPNKELLSFDRENASLKVADMMENITFLNKHMKDEYLNPSYIGLFVAGLNTMNVNLIKYAFDNYFTNEDLAYYEKHNLPTKKSEIIDIVNNIKTNHTIPEKYMLLLK